MRRLWGKIRHRSAFRGRPRQGMAIRAWRRRALAPPEVTIPRSCRLQFLPPRSRCRAPDMIGPISSVTCSDCRSSGKSAATARIKSVPNTRRSRMVTPARRSRKFRPPWSMARTAADFPRELGPVSRSVTGDRSFFCAQLLDSFENEGASGRWTNTRRSHGPASRSRLDLSGRRSVLVKGGEIRAIDRSSALVLPPAPWGS